MKYFPRRLFFFVFLCSTLIINPISTYAQLLTKPISLLPQSYVLEKTYESRPLWRLIVGSSVIGSSLLFLGFGGRALYLDNRCIDAPIPPSLKCTQVFDTNSLGVGLTITGVLLSIGGTILIALPGKKKISH